jgi:nucleoside-diphosphate-sugar epimerase
MLQNILFIGATGMLGMPVVKALLEQGFEVTAMVRDPEKAARLLPHNIELLQGDLKNKQEIERALVGQDTIYLNLSVNPSDYKNDFHTEKQGIANLLDILKHSGIKRIFYLSSLLQFYNTDWWVLKLKKEAVKKLVQYEIPTTIFYPSTFMETLDQKILVGNKLLLLGEAKYPMYLIAGDDYAIQVVQAIKLGDTLKGNLEFTIQGEQSYKMREAALIFRQNFPQKINIVEIPIYFFQLFTFLHPQLAYAACLSKALNNYHEQFNASKTWELLGKPEVTLENYARNLKLK